MSLAAPSSISSLAMATSAASSSSAVAAASTAAALGPLSSWASNAANSRGWVGSTWILSSAILTTYSTTKFLKYHGENDEMPAPAASTSRGGGLRALRQFRSILNSTQDPQHDHLQIAEETRKSILRPGLSRASLLTLYRFSGSLLLGLFLHSHFYQLSRLLPRFLNTVHNARQFLLPSLFLFIANYTNSIALDRIGISLTYTSKCGIPLITVLFTLLLDGVSALPSSATLLSLLPIAAGIGAASWNSPTFEPFGFLAAVVSTTSQAALNVCSKRAMRRTGIRGAAAQRAMVFVALGIGLAMTGASQAVERARELHESGDEAGQAAGPPARSAHPPLWLACLAVLAYHMEYVLSFSFVGLVEPITYGTCDALRRLLIIVMGRQLFGGDRFSRINLGGILTALAGALMYSMASAGGGAQAAKPRSM